MPFFQRLLFFVVLTLGVLMGVSIEGVLLYEWSSESSFCKRCHIMERPYRSWTNASHNKVACVDCHLPERIEDKVRVKIATGIPQFFNNLLTEPKLTVGSGRPDDATCRHCHNKGKFYIVKNGIRISHREHIKIKKMTCSTCHWETAHAAIEFSAKVKMSRCTNCHRAQKIAEECKACHSR